MCKCGFLVFILLELTPLLYPSLLFYSKFGKLSQSKDEGWLMAT